MGYTSALLDGTAISACLTLPPSFSGPSLSTTSSVFALGGADSNVFIALSRFVQKTCNMAFGRANRLTRGQGAYIKVGSNGQTLTRASGLDYKSYFMLCFKAFRAFILENDNYPFLEIEYEGYMLAVVSKCRLYIPSTVVFAHEQISDALEPPMQLPTDNPALQAKIALEEENKILIKILAQVKAISGGYTDALKSVSELATENAPDFLNEVSPIGSSAPSHPIVSAGTTTAAKAPGVTPTDTTYYKKDIFKYLNSAQLKNILLAKDRQLPHRNIENYPSVKISSYCSSQRIYALKKLFSESSLLKNETANETFSFKNQHIMAIGLPSGFLEKINDNIQITQESQTSIQELKEAKFVEPYSIIKIKIFKKDLLYPALQFEPLEFLVDTRLTVAPQGYQQVGSESWTTIWRRLVALQRYAVDPGSSLKAPVSNIKNYHGIRGGEGDDKYADLLEGYKTSPVKDIMSHSEMEEIVENIVIDDLLKTYIMLFHNIDLNESELVINTFLNEQRLDLGFGNSDISMTTVVNEAIQSTYFPLSYEEFNSFLTLESEKNSLKIKNDASILENNPDLTDSNITVAKQKFSGVLFKPEVTMNKILDPKIFENIFCFLVNPDKFKISSSISNVLKDTLNDEGVLREAGSDFYIVRKEENSDTFSSTYEFWVEIDGQNES